MTCCTGLFVDGESRSLLISPSTMCGLGVKREKVYERGIDNVCWSSVYDSNKERCGVQSRDINCESLKRRG